MEREKRTKKKFKFCDSYQGFQFGCSSMNYFATKTSFIWQRRLTKIQCSKIWKKCLSIIFWGRYLIQSIHWWWFDFYQIVMPKNCSKMKKIPFQVLCTLYICIFQTIVSTKRFLLLNTFLHFSSTATKNSSQKKDTYL